MGGYWLLGSTVSIYSSGMNIEVCLIPIPVQAETSLHTMGYKLPRLPATASRSTSIDVATLILMGNQLGSNTILAFFSRLAS